MEQTYVDICTIKDKSNSNLKINNVQNGRLFEDGEIRFTETISINMSIFRNKKIVENFSKLHTPSKRKLSSQSSNSLSSIFSHLTNRNYSTKGGILSSASSRRNSNSDSPSNLTSFSSLPQICIIFKLDNEVIYQSDAIAFSDSIILREVFSKEIQKNFRLFHIVFAEISSSNDTIPMPLGLISLRRRDIAKFSNEERWFTVRPISRTEYVSTQQNRKLGIKGIENQDILRDICGSVYLNISYNDSKKCLQIRVLDYCPTRTREASNSTQQQHSSSSNKPFQFLDRSFIKNNILIFSFTVYNSTGSKLCKTKYLKVSSDRKSETIYLDCDIHSLTKNITTNQELVDILEVSGDMSASFSYNATSTHTQDPQIRITIKHDTHQSTSSLDNSLSDNCGNINSQNNDILPVHGSLRIPLNEKTFLPKNKGLGSHWYYIKERLPPFQSTSTSMPDNTVMMNKHALGHVKMKVCLSIDHVLKLETYKPLHELLENKLSGSLGPKASLEFILLLQHLSLDQEKLCKSLMKIMLYSGQIKDFIKTLLSQYLSLGHDINTLFRSQTMTTKVIHELMRFVGKSYLRDTLKNLIDTILQEKKCCEVDPAKIKHKDELDNNVQNLTLYAELIFTDMVESRSKCPSLLQEIFNDLKEMILHYYPDRIDVQRLAISSFLVMRFFATAVLNPRQYSLINDQPEGDVNRTLLLVSKILQKITNSVVSGRSLINKEPWLTPILSRFEDESHRKLMIKFFDTICEPKVSNLIEEKTKENNDVLKDGYVVERHNYNDGFKNLKRFISTKHRYLVLHQNSLSWQKKKDTGECELKGIVCLEDITAVGILSDDENVFKISTMNREVHFQTKTISERNEWLIHIQKQQHRKTKRTMTQNDVIEIAEIDIEREIECIHSLLYKKCNEIKQFALVCESVSLQSELNDKELHDKVLHESLPEQIILQLKLDSSNKNAIKNCKSFSETCFQLLSIIEKLEKKHSSVLSKVFENSNCSTDRTKDDFFDDENYLLLASRIKQNTK
uniref:Ras GTPase-activating protein gap-1 (inferred by orthology to a C. elegans protein) n=1 Tax=Strongyloides venezuelensis TaxID=75913 RepID=A0A0K0FKS5_STRVS